MNFLPAMNLFLVSCIATGLAFAFIGFMKSYVTGTSIACSILETVLQGSVAAALAYIVGDVLKRLVT